MTKFIIDIASVPDRDSVVAEIWIGNEMMAEISQVKNESSTIEIYPKVNGSFWSVNTDDFIQTINLAKEKLLNK